MTAPTHIAFAAFSYTFLASMFNLPFSLVNILVLIVGSFLPDLDTPKSWAGRLIYFASHKIEARFGHRKLTHSLLFSIIFISSLYALLFLFPNFKYLIFPFTIGLCSHLFLDCFNKQGICLFWPSDFWCVIPGHKDYRIQVGANSEWVLLGILIISTALFYPVSRIGLIKSLHHVMADIQSAVMDYHDYSLTNEVYADIEAADNLTNKKVSGTFKVIGAQSKNILIVETNNKRLKSIGDYENNNLRPIKAHISKGEIVNYIIYKVELKYCQLNKLTEYLNSDFEQRIFGTIEPMNEVNLFKNLEYYEPVQQEGKALVLKYATYSDIARNGLTNIYIKKADLIIKTALKNNQVYTPKKIIEIKQSEDYVDKFELILTVENKDEILVKKGDIVSKGQIVAKIRRQETNIQIKETELFNFEKILNNLKDNVDIKSKQLKLKNLDYDIKEINDEFKKIEAERQQDLDFRARNLTVLQAQAKQLKKQYKKLELLRTQKDIDDVEQEIRKLKNGIGRMPYNLQYRLNAIKDEIKFIKYEINYLKRKRFENIEKTEKNIAKIKLELADLENKQNIKSPVDGLVAEVNYTMSIEYLIRANITILERKEEKYPGSSAATPSEEGESV